MTSLRRLLVGFVHSPFEAAWREAIADAAQHAGWQVYDVLDAEALAALEDTGPKPIVAFFSAPVDALPEGLEVLLITCAPAHVFAALTGGDNGSAAISDAGRTGGAAFASACDLASRGALVLEGESLSLPIGELGQVTRLPVPAPISADKSPLEMYRTIPPVEGAAATWSLSLLGYPVGRPGQEVDSGDPAIDLTGRGRIMVHGPYIPLPPGKWALQLEVLVDPEGGAAHLRFEWGVGMDVVAAYPVINRAGRYEVQLIREWPEVGEAQLRVWAQQPHFQGRFQLLACSVAKVP